MSTLAKKLKIARKELGLQQAKIAEMANMSQRDISLLENDKREFIPTRYIQFLNNNGINLNWLFEDEDESIDLLETNHFGGTKMSSSQQRIRKADLSFKRNILMVGIDAMASYPHHLKSPEFLNNLPTMLLPGEDYKNATYRCFQLPSDEMVNTILANEYAIAKYVDNWEQTVTEGHIYVVVTRKGIFIGRLSQVREDRISLTFDNPNYGPISISNNNILEVWLVNGKLGFGVSSGQHSILSDVKIKIDELQREIQNLKAVQIK